MDVSVKGNEQLTKLLNDWYAEIRSRHIASAHRLKEEIELMINDIEQDQNLLIYYSLLKFRHDYLINNLGVSRDSFNKIDSLGQPTDDFLSYYYNFFKAIYYNEIGSYTLAREHYEKAESLIEYIPDASIERAELHYKLATFSYDTYRFLPSVNHAKQARDIYAQHNGYETNIAFCENIMGMACIELKEWELAEEHLLSATGMFQKMNEEKFTHMTRGNIGLMYASQNLSDLAIKYLSEVIEYNPQHYKAIYVQAREYYKLGKLDIAYDLVSKGCDICSSLGSTEYTHHLSILKKLIKRDSMKELENAVLEGVSYFESEELYSYVSQYTDELAMKFHEEENLAKAGKYFHIGFKSRQKKFEKEALK